MVVQGRREVQGAVVEHLVGVVVAAAVVGVERAGGGRLGGVETRRWVGTAWSGRWSAGKAWSTRRRGLGGGGTEDLEEEGGSGVGGGGREHTSGVADAVVVEVAGAVTRRGGADRKSVV